MYSHVGRTSSPTTRRTDEPGDGVRRRPADRSRHPGLWHRRAAVGGDRCGHPSGGASYGAGSNTTTWIVVFVVAWFFGLGGFLGGFSLLFTRQKVRRQVEGRR